MNRATESIGKLRELAGREHESPALNRHLRDFARSFSGKVIGAMLVSCADETEASMVEAFQHWFAANLLPELRPWQRAPFRGATLGGRYEWGALAVAEQHFATPESEGAGKVLLVKINSHVALRWHHGTPKFGTYDRYHLPSDCCGALNALFRGVAGPCFEALYQDFSLEGRDRLSTLRAMDDDRRHLVPLYLALVNARIQARRAVVDLQNYEPRTPTLYVVLPCVTLNQPARDSELVVGAYVAECHGREQHVRYVGLGDHPDEYEFSVHRGKIHVGDADCEQQREARDHRQEVLRLWMQRREQEALWNDERVQRLAAQLKGAERQDGNGRLALVKSLGNVLLDVAPVPLAIALFANGMVAAYHLYAAHRLARGQGERHEAEAMVREFLDRIDQLPPGQVQTLMDLLTRRQLENA